MDQELLRRSADPTEGSLRLPEGTVRVRVVNRSQGSVRVSFVTGEVAVDSGGEDVADEYDSGALAPYTRMLFYASDVAGTLFEVFVQHSKNRMALGPGWSDGFSI